MTPLDARYARVGRAYDALDDANVRLDTGSAVESAITIRYPQRYVPDGATVVAVGSGAGHDSELRAWRGCHVHLADVSQRLLDAAASRLEAAGLGDRRGGGWHSVFTHS